VNIYDEILHSYWYLHHVRDDYHLFNQLKY